MLARSVGDKTLQERFREDLGHVRQSFDMSAMAGLVSLSLIGLGMLLMALACWAYALAVALVRVRCLILERAQEEQL
jgi:hypothetical protein